MAQKPTIAAKAARRKNRQRLAVLLLVLILLLGLVGQLGYSRLQAPLPTLSAISLRPAVVTSSSTTLAWPSVGQAAIGANNYGVLDIHGPQKAVPTASVAKLITALSVLQMKPLHQAEPGPTLTLTQADVDLYNSYVSQDGSVTAVTDGEQISEYQALQAMLLPSSNNMADSTAIWAFGSLAAYTSYANQQLATWGLDHTQVGSDASGFSPTTTSTASDLVKLGELAAANPVIAEITAQSSADIPVAGIVHNVNWLLGTAGINGLKTGNSDQAGGVFLFSANYPVPGGPAVTIVGAVLAAPTLSQAMNSAVSLLTSAQKAFTMSIGLAAGQAVGVYGVPWSSSITAVTGSSVKALAWQGSVLSQPTVSLHTITAPQSKGSPVGTAGFGSNTTPVVLSQPIPAPSWWWRLMHN